MAAPIDIPKSNSNLDNDSPVLSYGTYNRVKSEDSDGVPLQTPWTLWLDKTVPGMSAANFENHLEKIYTFNTIQGFWAVFNHVPSVDDIQIRYSYHLMREQRRPLWEDPSNHGGGAWRLRCAKKDTAKIWKELLLATIGEQLSDSLAKGDEIVGLTVSVRDRMDVVQLWNQSAEASEKGTVIQKIVEILRDFDFQAPLYKPHVTHYAYGNERR